MDDENLDELVDDKYSKRKRKWYHLDIEHTPCARRTYLYGMLSGLAIGAIHYVARGIVLRACDFAVGGFIVSSILIWYPCRYQHAKKRKELKKIVEILNSKNNSIDKNQ